MALPTTPSIPADTGAHQQPIVARLIFENLAEFRVEALGGQPRRLVEQLDERRALQRQHAEFGEDLLLPQALHAASG